MKILLLVGALVGVLGCAGMSVEEQIDRCVLTTGHVRIIATQDEIIDIKCGSIDQ